MAKLFWIGKDETTSHHTHHAPHAHHEDDHHEEAIDVTIDHHREHESDIGQIAVDIMETSSEIVIVAPVAWVDPSRIDISLARNILTISGEREHFPIYLDAKRMLVEECFYGPFSRSIILPENLAFNKIRATIDLHALIIHIPKLVFTSKTIQIDRWESKHKSKAEQQTIDD